MIPDLMVCDFLILKVVSYQQKWDSLSVLSVLTENQFFFLEKVQQSDFE